MKKKTFGFEVRKRKAHSDEAEEEQRNLVTGSRMSGLISFSSIYFLFLWTALLEKLLRERRLAGSLHGRGERVSGGVYEFIYSNPNPYPWVCGAEHCFITSNM